MGGAVSSGRDNSELVDNLKSGNYIRTPRVEAAFRAVDRADYMPPDSRNLAYKDLAWKNGQLHLSAPCIYSEVMEGLELCEGLTFLNVGSGTGYLSTMVGLLLGARGINHGIEIQQYVLLYAGRKLGEFLSGSPAVDEFDFCMPTFVHGNGLCLPPGSMRYDRVYCGASCPEEYHTYFKHLINVGGILVMPLNDNLLQVRRTSETDWSQRSLLSVSFASLVIPAQDPNNIKPPELSVSPPPLQVMVRSVIRRAVQHQVLARRPELREFPARPPAVKKRCSRRICIPIDGDSDMELESLHDLEDRASGAAEMNALLSLVLSMGQSRAAGALRFDSEADSDSSSASSRSHSPSRSRSRSHSRSPGLPPWQPRRSRSGSVDSVYSKTTLELPPSDEDANGNNVLTEADQQSKQGETTEENKVEASTSEMMDTIPLDEPQTSASAADKPAGTTSAKRESKAGSSKSHSTESDGDSREEWLRQRGSKRNKLDSGIGEEPSPESAGAGAGAAEPGEAEPGAGRTARGDPACRPGSSPDPDPQYLLAVDHMYQGTERIMRRMHKRCRPALSDSSDSSNSSSAGSPVSPRRHKKKRATPDPYRARRDYISLSMQRALSDLPLPPPLQLYLNLDRPFPRAS